MPIPESRLKHEDELILAHLGLARSIAREYRGKRLGDDDLEAEARLALVEAARTYDPEGHPGVPFDRYAGLLIRVRLRDTLYRAPVVRMARDRERDAMTGRALAPRRHDVAIEHLGILPAPPDDPDAEARAIADALRYCDPDERRFVYHLLDGDTVPEASRRLGLPLHRGRSLLRRAQLALHAAFVDRGFNPTPMARMD